MKKENRLLTLVTAALLCAIGIVIPMFCPKIVIGPASFTLASHVPIFIAMFISPPVAVAVALGTTLGFFIAGFPIVIVLRALSHIVFVMIGAFLLKKQPRMLSTAAGAVGFGLLTAVIHAACEVLVVTYFYFGNQMTKANYANGYVVSVLLLVGFGGVVHSMIDYGIAVAVWKPLGRTVRFPVSVNNILSAGRKTRKEA
jgi:niacin transporter